MRWPTGALVLLATLTVYGLDRWRDRPKASPRWRRAGLPLLLVSILVQLALLGHCWVSALEPAWTSLAFFVGGQGIALSYAGVGPKGQGLKHLPGAKAVVVAMAVSIACVGMVDAFGAQPDPLRFWSRPQVHSATAFLLAITGCNAQLFDLRDRDRDARAGVPSAAVLLGPGGAKGLAAGWLLGFGALSFGMGESMSISQWAPRLLGIGAGMFQIWRTPFQIGASGYFWALDGVLLLPPTAALALSLCG